MYSLAGGVPDVVPLALDDDRDAGPSVITDWRAKCIHRWSRAICWSSDSVRDVLSVEIDMGGAFLDGAPDDTRVTACGDAPAGRQSVGERRLGGADEQAVLGEARRPGCRGPPCVRRHRLSPRRRR